MEDRDDAAADCITVPSPLEPYGCILHPLKTLRLENAILKTVENAKSCKASQSLLLTDLGEQKVRGSMQSRDCAATVFQINVGI